MDKRICVIGGGYVGFPLALEFSRSSIVSETFIFDVDDNKVNAFKAGKSYLSDFSDEEMKEFAANGGVITSDIEECREAIAFIIAVPTPLDEHRSPDLSFVRDAFLSIKSIIKKGDLISLESTTYPGTTREIVSEVFKETDLIVGNDIFISYSPEREDPGTKSKSNFK